MELLKKTSIAALITWALAATVQRAWRSPNDFAEAHWLLDYQFGFIKRGLPGEILSRLTGLFSIPITENLIACLSTTLFLLFCVTLMGVSLRIIHKAQWSAESILVTLVFICSPFIVMSAHIIGYYDNIVVMLGIAALYLIQKNRIWAGALILAISVLVHENTLLLTFPVFCFSWLLANQQRKRANQAPLAFVPLLLPPFMLLLVLLGMIHLPAGDFTALYSQKLTAYSFIEGDRDHLVPQWIVGGIHEANTPHIGEFLLHLGSMESQNLITPSMLVIIFFIACTFQAQQGNRELLILAGVCLAPQLIHLAAWDTHRIWTYSILTPFLALWVCAENNSVIRQEVPLRLVCLIGILLNIVILTPLMDGQYDQLFDIDKRLAYFGPVIIGSLLMALQRKRPG